MCVCVVFSPVNERDSSAMEKLSFFMNFNVSVEKKRESCMGMHGRGGSGGNGGKG